MGLFGRKKAEAPRFPAEEYEPVLKCSICTGEQVACVRERATGRVHEIGLIRSRAELEEFGRPYGLTPEQIRKLY